MTTNFGRSEILLVIQLLFIVVENLGRILRPDVKCTPKSETITYLARISSFILITLQRTCSEPCQVVDYKCIYFLSR